MNDQRTLTRRGMKNYLTRVGYNPNRANQVARAYEQTWLANRANVKSAMRKLVNGKNLNRLGFPANVRNLAQRRVAPGQSAVFYSLDDATVLGGGRIGRA